MIKIEIVEVGSMEEMESHIDQLEGSDWRLWRPIKLEMETYEPEGFCCAGSDPLTQMVEGKPGEVERGTECSTPKLFKF